MATSFGFVSCNKNNVVEPPIVTAPSYASSMNTFSYSVKAQQFSSAILIPLTFTGDSLAYGLSVTVTQVVQVG